MPSAAAQDVLQAILERRAAERRRAPGATAAPVALPFAQRAPLKVYLNAGERDRVMGDQAPLPFSNRIAGAFDAARAMQEPSEALYAAKHRRAQGLPPPTSFLEDVASLGPRAFSGAIKMGQMLPAAAGAMWNDPLGSINSVGLAGQAATDAIVQGMVKPFMQFGDPNVDPVENAADLTMSVMGGSSVVPAEANSLRVFGGPAARTANVEKLALAKKMTAEGVPRERIWQETGWYKAPDKEWKFEISDEASRVPDRTIDALTQNVTSGSRAGPASSVLEHPELYAAYPELADLGVNARYATDYPGSTGYYKEGTPGDAQFFGTDPEIGVAVNALAGSEGPRSVMLHELQHPIQRIEGFGRGGSPAAYAHGPMFDEKARSLQGALSQELTGGMSHSPKDIIQDIKFVEPARAEAIAREHGFTSIWDALKFLKQQDEMRTPMGQYRRLAGEVEARNVQDRRNMTAEERRATPPWKTQDVPDEQQIVRFRGGLGDELQASIRAYHGSPHDFERFDSSKIGTGEGAQAYGHGLYFAEREGVAKDYRNRLAPSAPDDVSPDAAAQAKFEPEWRKLVEELGPTRDRRDRLYHTGEYQLNGAEEFQQLDKRVGEIDTQMNALHQQMVDDTVARNPHLLKGRMYEVDIAADPEHFLDWDKPLSEQPKAIQDAMVTPEASALRQQLDDVEAQKSALADDRDPKTNMMRNEKGWFELARESDRLQGELSKVVTADMKGGFAYSNFGKDRPSASERLREAGIPGIRYLDQGSRLPLDYGAQIRYAGGKWAIDKEYVKKYSLPETFDTYAEAESALKQAANKAGTRNFVVFDDRLISILKKYGLPISAAGLAALSQLHPQEAQAAQQQNLPRY